MHDFGFGLLAFDHAKVGQYELSSAPPFATYTRPHKENLTCHEHRLLVM